MLISWTYFMRSVIYQSHFNTASLQQARDGSKRNGTKSLPANYIPTLATCYQGDRTLNLHDDMFDVS